MNKGRAKVLWTILSFWGVIAVMTMQFFGTSKFSIISAIIAAFLTSACCILSLAICLYAGNLINKMWGRINGFKLTIGFKLLLSIFTFISSLFYMFLIFDWVYNPAGWNHKIPEVLIDCWSIWQISVLVNYILFSVDSIFDFKELLNKETAKFVSVPQFGDLAITMGFMNEKQVNKVSAMQEDIMQMTFKSLTEYE